MKTSLVKHLVVGLGQLALNLQLHSQGFALSSTPSVGNSPTSVAAADIKGDGKMDLISANESANTLTVLTNDGNGILVSNASYSTIRNPQIVIAVDVNGDGKIDLVCAGYPEGGPGRLEVLTNNGSGGFVAASTNIIGGQLQMWVVPADVNGDGKIDLICPDTSSKIMILTNAGGGIFSVAPAPPSTSASWCPLAVDVNGDGKPDLIDMPVNSYYLRVLTNAGDGTFALSSTNYANTSWTSFISAADVNGDGWVDVIIPAFNSGSGKTLLVLTNNRHGYFGSNAVYTVGTSPRSVTVADVNGDGMVDLICTLNTGLIILTNNGSGFGSNATLNVGATSFYDNAVAAADVNGDGRLDLINANINSPGTLSILTNTLTFLPKLTLKYSSNNVVVSWPSQWTGWAGWALQQNTNLNDTNWTSFSGTISDDDTTKTVTNSSLLGNMFFRLSHP